MPRIAEIPNREVEASQVAPPIQQVAVLEQERGIVAVKDAQSRMLVGKSNAAVGNMLKNSLKSCLKLSKTVFGSVGKVFNTFASVRRIIGGI